VFQARAGNASACPQAAEPGLLDAGGRHPRIRRLDRVVFPRTGTTKGELFDYSVRAKERPTVSTPLAWSELERALDTARADDLVFEMGDVLERVAEHGDLWLAERLTG
jgi:DNA primase